MCANFSNIDFKIPIFSKSALTILIILMAFKDRNKNYQLSFPKIPVITYKVKMNYQRCRKTCNIYGDTNMHI